MPQYDPANFRAVYERVKRERNGEAPPAPVYVHEPLPVPVLFGICTGRHTVVKQQTIILIQPPDMAQDARIETR